MLRLVMFLLLTMWGSIAIADEAINIPNPDQQTFTYDDDYEDKYCRATVILFDSRGGFRSSDKAFSWCFDRVKAWNLDQSKGWRERFCRVSKQQKKDSYGDYYYEYSSNFQHNDRRFSSRYGGRIFFDFEQHYSKRLFKGTNLRIAINFSDSCDYDE